jgi:hypothetical protein
MMDGKVMKHAPVFSAAFLFAVVSLFAASPTRAQDTPPQENPAPNPSQPKPAGREYDPMGGDQADTPDQAVTLNPDNTALTGVLVPGVGTPDMRHSYWVPGIQYGNFVRSNSLTQPTVSDWNSASFVAGNLSLLQAWSHSQLTLNYSGGGSFSTDKSQGDGYYHQLGVMQAFNWRRWQLSFIDQFSYLPQSQFGFGAGSSLATPGIAGSLGPSLPALETSYQPSQSIFFTVGTRYSNSATTQVVLDVSPRGSLTFSGSYGILRFVQAGNINSDDSIFSAGYNYALSKKDTIGVLYRFSGYEYIGNPQAITNHVAEMAYGRKVTGRVAFQLFLGPQITVFRVPLNGVTQKTAVSGGGNLTYAFSRTGFSLNYNHGVTGGGGALTGSNTDQIQGAVNRQISRVWHGNVTFGYARNAALTNPSGALLSPTFNAWFAGAGLDRPLGRNANLTIGYTAYVQDTGLPGCPPGSCISYLQHQIAVSFQWHTRPLILR